jgi:hypothetical protein
LKNGSPSETEAVLTRIRQSVDVDIESLVRQIRCGNVLLQLALIPDATFRYVFPYVKSMPAHLIANPDIAYRTSLLYLDTAEEPQLEHSNSRQSSQASAQGAIAEERRMYLTPYHAVQIVDSRISSVKASTWTTVTADDEFVQKLLEIYFLVDHPFYPLIHKDAFLEDMISGRRRYCSSLLVNALLTQACVSLHLTRRCRGFCIHR